VVPVDFSDRIQETVAVGLELAGAAERVHLVHVLPDYTSGEPGLLWNVLDQAQRRERARQQLRERLEGQAEGGMPMVVLFGDPGREIAQFAADCRADLIVLPSHGRRGLSRALLGSVAERLIRLAPCPVLVLKGGEPAEDG